MLTTCAGVRGGYAIVVVTMLTDMKSVSREKISFFVKPQHRIL